MRTEAMASVVSGGAAFSFGTLTLEIFGVPLPVLLAGFAGSVVALAFLPPMQRWRLFGAVAIGTLVAAYVTVLVSHVTGWPDGTHKGIAFVLGAIGHTALSKGWPILEGWLRKPGASP